MNSKTPPSLIDMVQNHERVWGMETYLNRPNLADILSAPVVVFWEPVEAKDDKARRVTIELYKDLAEVEAYLARLVIRSGVELPKKRIARIFENGKALRVKTVKVVFEEAP